MSTMGGAALRSRMSVGPRPNLQAAPMPRCLMLFMLSRPLSYAPIEAGVAIDHPRDAELGVHALPGCLAKACAQTFIVDQPSQLLAQCRGIPGREEQSRGTMGDDLGIAADITGYGGRAGGHRFEQRVRHTFADGG